jgi:hypothetical protein
MYKAVIIIALATSIVNLAAAIKKANRKSGKGG